MTTFVGEGIPGKRWGVALCVAKPGATHITSRGAAR